MWTSYGAQHAACLPSSFSCRDNFHTTHTNVPPTPLLPSTPIHNSLTRRSGPTPSLWNWNPTKTFCCCQATATPSPHSTSSTVASCSEGNFLLLRLGTKRNLKESQRRINKNRKKKRSFSSEPPTLLLAAEAGRLPDQDSWCVCAPATV